jgi:hypothetical protein
MTLLNITNEYTRANISNMGNSRISMTRSINMTNTNKPMNTRPHKVHCRSRSPIRPESPRRRKKEQHFFNGEKNLNSSSQSNNSQSKKNIRKNKNKENLALALEKLAQAEEEEERCQQMVDTSDDECTYMDISVEVDVDDYVYVKTSCDDDDMQVEERDDHDIRKVIDLTNDDGDVDGDDLSTKAVMTGESLSRTDTHTSLKSHRTVSFGAIYTREYSLTVGDHPCSADSVGLTLDWVHASEYAVSVEQADWTAQIFSPPKNKNDDSKNNSPRRRVRKLSASERRKRIISVTGCNPSDVRAAEYNMALQRYDQEHAFITNKNRSTKDNETVVDTREASYDSQHLLQHQQHLQVLYSCFQEQLQHEQKKQQQHQRQCQQTRQIRRSQRSAPEPAVV